MLPLTWAIHSSISPLMVSSRLELSQPLAQLLKILIILSKRGISQVMILRKRNCSWRLCWNGIWGREDPGHQRLGNSLHRVVGLTLCPNYQHHIWLLKECHDWGCINRGPGLCCQQQQERQSCHRCNYGGSNSYCCRIHKLPHLNE
ncbi:uncharacterized protein LOC109806083 isoform X2 [Cajanus cajan]|uniref:uncharacterized protein LOC109806083 isoform X2 n=1 Tax=Cajanus cajan TaxID=3821 RepID=UPI0010FB3908|nr:uncharacterized protein LOC109806083 isoform X2 [Cajanus cajan]